MLLSKLSKAALENVALSLHAFAIELLDRVNTRSGVFELERSRVVNNNIFTALPVLKLLALVRVVLESLCQLGDIERWTFEESSKTSWIQ